MNRKGILNDFVDVVLLMIGIAILVIFIGTILYNGKVGAVKATGIMVYRTNLMQDYVLDMKQSTTQEQTVLTYQELTTKIDFIARFGYVEGSSDDPFVQAKKEAYEK